MILMGYPGVGKSTFCKKTPYAIDLESSLFHDIFELYVDVALDLSRQNKLVMVSCHNEVYGLLLKKLKPSDSVGILFPSDMLKDRWIGKLKDRYIRSKLKKDERAYYRATTFYDSDILAIINDFDKRFQQYKIESMLYDFNYNVNTDKFKLINHKEKSND